MTIRLHQTQSGYLGTFELLINAASLTLATAGATHQSVTLTTGDLVWLTGIAEENGPYVYDGTGFVRPSLQQSLAAGAAIIRGAEFMVSSGTSAGKRFRVSTVAGGKDSYGVRFSAIGDDNIEVVDVSAVAGAAVEREPFELDLGSSDISGALNGINKDFDLSAYSDVYLVAVTINGLVANRKSTGEVSGDYTFDEATGVISFTVAPTGSDVVVATILGVAPTTFSLAVTDMHNNGSVTEGITFVIANAADTASFTFYLGGITPAQIASTITANGLVAGSVISVTFDSTSEGTLVFSADAIVDADSGTDFAVTDSGVNAYCYYDA